METLKDVVKVLFAVGEPIFIRKGRYIDEDLRDLYNEIYHSDLKMDTFEKDKENMGGDVKRIREDFRKSLKKYLSEKSVNVETIKAD